MKIKVKAQVKELSMIRHLVKTGKAKQKPKYKFSYGAALNFLETKITGNTQFIEAVDISTGTPEQKSFASLKSDYQICTNLFNFFSQHARESFLVTLEGKDEKSLLIKELDLIYG